ncbi:phosphoribosylformylglycinamidine synthase I [Chloroflexi bacterium TSY]|nr:phosphoribosylformylglycinamidine synthase I [Chloroflexi bacterium TSY]
MQANILIIHASGTNRDEEAARACHLAGGEAEIVHINQLLQGEKRFDDYQMLLIPGGFSYGDALGAGTRLSLDMQVYFAEALQTFVDSGKRILGICNGFQVLVKTGLLPGWDVDHSARRNSNTSTVRQVTLTENERGKFECRWVHLMVESGCQADFLHPISDLIFCPVAHGEGNFQVRDSETADRLKRDGLIAFRYVDDKGEPAAGRYPLNPNGSVLDIAGICNEQGNVVGLMPHPEDHVVSIQNPLGQSGHLGLALFRAMMSEL